MCYLIIYYYYYYWRKIAGITILRLGKVKAKVYYLPTCGECNSVLKVPEDYDKFSCPRCKNEMVLDRDKTEKVSKCGGCESEIEVMDVEKGDLCYRCYDAKCEKCGRFGLNFTGGFSGGKDAFARCKFCDNFTSRKISSFKYKINYF